MRRTTAFLCVVCVMAHAAACGPKDVRLMADPPAGVHELWQEPASVEQRDLFHGPGGVGLKPRETTFTFVTRDTTGWSPGFDVRDDKGTEWSVKLGPEAQTEVVASRILWAIGFHQPPTYYLESWSLTGQESGPQPAGRFRPTLSNRTIVSDWSWYENPFVGSREFGGLVAVNLILNNWDWKTSNNKVYDLTEPVNGARRWWVVRDLGASLGKTSYPGVLKWFRLRGFGQGSRNDLPGFEQQGFITRVDSESGPEFDYSGIYEDVVDTVTVADVGWVCGLLNRLTEEQWRDAFRAAGYNTDQTDRYVRKIKAKVAQGLALSSG